MYMCTIAKRITTHIATWCHVCTVIESPSTTNTQPNAAYQALSMPAPSP